MLTGVHCAVFKLTPGSRSTDDVMLRWRLVLWTAAACVAWARLDVTWVNYVTTTLVSAALNAARTALTNKTVFTGKYVVEIMFSTAWIIFINGMVVITTFPVSMQYEYLAKKMIWREASLLASHTQKTFVAITTVCVVVLMLGRLDGKRLGLAVLAENLKSAFK